MSLLNLLLDKQIIYAVCNTLASYPEDLEPRSFTTKVYTVPHLEGLICGTGVGQFVLEWYCRAIERMVVRDLHNLDEFTPNALREIWQRYQVTSLGRELTSTIYHLGYDRVENQFVGWVYPSVNDFASQELAYGTYFKPQEFETDEFDYKGKLEDFVRIAEIQKAPDRARPKEQQIGIGGHLISYIMMARGSEDDEGEPELTTTVSRFYQFDDCGTDWLRACNKLPPNPGVDP